MRFSEEILKYLENESFHNGFSVQIADKHTKVYMRNKFLVDYVAGKRVVHLGCANHLPLIDDMIDEGTWLHAKLNEVCLDLLGVDIDSDSIEHLRKHHRYGDSVICADIRDSNVEQISSKKWDTLLIPDVLEHIDNPVEFLRSIRDNYMDNFDNLIITVPNAFDWKNIDNLKLNKEVVNSDHRYWFTPYTLARVLASAGLRLVEFQYADGMIARKRGLRSKLLLLPFIKFLYQKKMLRRLPAMSETIIAFVTFK